LLLIESDGKRLLQAHGIPVPASSLVIGQEDVAKLAAAHPSTPKIVKAQVPVGGRGKAGGVLRAESSAEAAAAATAMLGRHIKGHTVRACLIEEPIAGSEHYLALLVDAGSGGIRLLYSDAGGIDIEQAATTSGHMFDRLVRPDRNAFDAAISELEQTLDPTSASAIAACARQLGALFFDKELLLAEINPLFLRPNGQIVAGDAKIVIDLNAIERHDDLKSMLSGHRDWYPDAWRKIQEQFDFIELDAQGTIGLVTTGAGLSMMLLDELTEKGARPFNFCDVRTGQMRGDPSRLLAIFRWLKEAPNVRMVLINIFAGITDLAEFARTLVLALSQMPGWNPPIVARLIGNNEELAMEILRTQAPQIRFETDLEKAISLSTSMAQEANHA
jgi:succinyl-CoA synthetase beta subunit